MPRKAITERYFEVTADAIHAGDILLHRLERNVTHVFRVTRRAGRVTIATPLRDTYTVDATRVVRVQAEQPCRCGGTGVWSWGGTVNGEPVKTGVDFHCQGKGYQNRSDVIRNITYMEKYQKI